MTLEQAKAIVDGLPHEVRLACAIITNHIVQGQLEEAYQLGTTRAARLGES